MMPPSGAIPEQLLTVVAASTVFTVMFVLGLGIVLSEFRWVWGRPSLVAKGLFSVLIAVPALALIVTRAFDLGRAAQIGIALMALSPGAPAALGRWLSAAGGRASRRLSEMGWGVRIPTRGPPSPCRVPHETRDSRCSSRRSMPPRRRSMQRCSPTSSYRP